MPKRRQPSTIDLLPDDIRSQLQALLRDPRVQQLDAVERINAILAEKAAAGVLPDGAPEKLSKSAVNRYDLKMREAGQKLRESREVAEMWIAKLGAAPQGQVGNLVNEILRTLSFDAALWVQSGEIDKETAPAVAKMLKDLALTTMRLEKAANLNVEREREIRQQALEAAADAIGDEARAQGMDEEQARFWREKVLGVR